jgi:pyridoxal phosphate enzyme (YggS family)
VDAGERAALEQRLRDVQRRIEDAAVAADRDPAGITTVVVTKFQPVELVRALAELGVADLGESRHQEARAKAAELPGARWHFIGQLQTNKARQVARYAAAIHSVDRAELVDALAGTGAPVFLQVRLGDGEDAGRGGAEPAEVPALAERAAEAGLPVLGVMAVAPLGEDPDRAFARLADLGNRVNSRVPGATAVSAGMSGDFAAALRHGATHLRIGTAITGPRPATP